MMFLQAIATVTVAKEPSQILSLTQGGGSPYDAGFDNRHEIGNVMLYGPYMVRV